MSLVPQGSMGKASTLDPVATEQAKCCVIGNVGKLGGVSGLGGTLEYGTSPSLGGRRALSELVSCL